ncbi:MAG: CHRD domain-containing protein [Planctomycetes bacterium]|nr:CHRD domain-containing protein [Planctomycetota bacterium]
MFHTAPKALAALAALGLLAGGASAQSRYISYNMNGAQEVPPNSSTATGSGSLIFDASTNTLSVSVTTTGVVGAVAAHVHRGAFGVNGPVVFGLTGGPDNWTGSGVLSAADVANLRSEGLYVNVHSGTFPGGEIRGQIILPPIVINEFQYDDSGTDDREFVELYNRTPFPIDITGWRIECADGSTVPDNNPDFVLSGLIPANGYFVAGSALVPNVTQVVGTTNLLENDQETISLRDNLDVIHDSLVYERNKNENPGTFPTGRAEGEGIWGNHQSIDLHETSWARVSDGYDSDNNRDFALLTMTPGANNNASAIINYNENFDALILGSNAPNWNGSFKEPVIIDPTFSGGNNPTALPASPQGGQAMVAWDTSGGGNGSTLQSQPFDAVKAEGWFYLQSTAHPTGNVPPMRETWAFGVMGTGDTFFNDPDPGAGLGALTANGNTGVSWIYQIGDGSFSPAAGMLYLVDHNDGGWGAISNTPANVLAAIQIQTGVNDGWQRLSISVCRGQVFARFGGTVGVSDGQLFTGTTQVGRGMVYLGYREFVVNNATLTPLTVDDLRIRALNGNGGFVPYGVAAPTNSGTPLLGANGCPCIGSTGFALELSGLKPNALTLLVGDFLPLNPAINLGLLGGNPAGEVYVLGGALNVALPTSGAGTASFPAAIPLDPTLLGGQITFQDWDLDLTLPFALPIGTSRALTTIIQ